MFHKIYLKEFYMKRRMVEGFLALCLSVFVVATCNKGATSTDRVSSRGLISIEEITKYLSATTAGGNADDPVRLNVKIDLQNMNASEGGWQQLLNVINTAGKYVALDLSDCTMPNTKFNPAGNVGKNFIVSIVLPKVAKNIEGNSFRGFTNVVITVPDSFTSIGDYAFAGCRLNGVTIPDTVTSIGCNAFDNTQLKSITIPSSVTSIGDYAFAGCNFTSITIPGSVTSIGRNAFGSNGDFVSNKLTSISIGENVALIYYSIEDHANSFGYGSSFEVTYNNGGKQAGIYTRPNTSSKTWTKQ